MKEGRSPYRVFFRVAASSFPAMPWQEPEGGTGSDTLKGAGSLKAFLPLRFAGSGELCSSTEVNPPYFEAESIPGVRAESQELCRRQKQVAGESHAREIP